MNQAINQLGKLFKNYLIFSGVLLQFVIIAGLVIAVKHYQLTPTQVLVKGMDRLGLDAPWLVALLSPEARYKDHVFDGKIREMRPRIILPQLADWQGTGAPEFMQLRARLYKDQALSAPDVCHGGGVLGLAGCWVETGDIKKAEELVGLLKTFILHTPDGTGNYGNVWELAFAYDLLSTYPQFTASDKSLIEINLEAALKEYLALLDESSPSLWHGRANLASSAWLCAVALGDEGVTDGTLIRRAQGHFLDLMQALSITEAWPEGYNYWINNRAFLITLAATAYLNGLEGAKYADEIRNTLKRVGLWHVYATRPDNRIEGLGDEGPRVDLKDETRRPIDIMNQVIRMPVLANFSRYLYQLHGVESYFRGYRWGFHLFHDPTIPLLPGLEAGQLTGMERYLPTAEIFGRDAVNMAYVRSGWGPDDTFISFRAGNSFTHHGHYDAGHFTLFKGTPLAVNSGTYGSVFSSHRLNYAIRTVAKNSLLVMRPGEQVRPNRFFDDNVADGGQRVVIPTGSVVESVEHWQNNLGQGAHFEGGKVIAYDHRPGVYTYIASDITGAYNNTRYDTGGRGGKVSQVTRELVYLDNEDRLLLHDVVVSTDPDYTKKWLLHTITRPDARDLKVLLGQPDNGILETFADEVRVQNGRGYLRIQRLYPEDALIRLVGGKDYMFYVEADGDDSDLDGVNMQQGVNFKPWFDTGMWRIEVQPRGRRKLDHFLMALSPGLDAYRTGEVAPLPVSEGSGRGAVTNDSALLFVDRASHGPMIFPRRPEYRHVYVFGLPAGQEAVIGIGDARLTGRVNESGVLTVDLGGYRGDRVRLSWDGV